MATKTTLNKARALCKTYKVKYSFTNTESCHSHPWLNYIHVCKTLSNRDFLSCLFHEIQHCLNYRNRKYFKYHSGRMTRRDAKRWALPAEIYTDKEGKKLAEKHGFNYYTLFYKNTPECKKWLMDYIDGLKEVS